MNGVLLANIGTPDTANPSDVYKYLKQFLLDSRIIDQPFLRRQFVVRAMIVPFRYKKSAKQYQQIWTEEGSPLLVNTKKLALSLQQELGSNYLVAFGMRYGNPSIHEGLEMLKKNKVERIHIVPLFPQYASGTTGSIIEEAFSHIKRWNVIPEIRTLGPFWNHPQFLATWHDMVRPYNLSDYDHILFSYHGLPISHPDSGYYQEQCLNTTKRLVEPLQLAPDRFTVSFQSRLGRKKWLSPYTTEVLQTLAKSGKKRVLVFSPSFVADCLETLFELHIEAKEAFIAWGGTTLTCVGCPNEHPGLVKTLSLLVKG